MGVMTMVGPAKLPKPPKPPEWATWVPSRTTKSQFATHNNLGHAKAALRTSARGAGRYYVDAKGKRRYENSLLQSALYRLVDGEWRVVATVQNGDYPSEHPIWTCKTPEQFPPVFDVVLEEE